MYVIAMSNLAGSEKKSEIKLRLSFLSIPLLIAVLIVIQIFFRPVNFLFADDWLLLDYLIPDKKISFFQFFQLINGHNVLTTKLSLVFLTQIFGAKTLIAFALVNVFVAYISSILILRLLTIGKNSLHLMILTGSIFFFNFKQLQNYNMIISAHFLHSLLCIAIYLTLKNSGKEKWRWIPLLVAPFTGGFGITVVMLEGYEVFRRLYADKRIRNFLHLFSCVTILFLAYGINLLSGNVLNNTPQQGFLSNIYSGLLHPWYFPSYILSIFGTPFTPSSKYMSLLSQILGAIVIVLFYRVRNTIGGNTVIRQVVSIVVIASLLFTLSGYDGTSLSLQNAYSNRYTTSTMLLIIALAAGIMNTSGMHYKRITLLVMITLSLTSGLKSGSEWVSLRNHQSQILLRDCRSSLQIDKETCFAMSKSQSFITNPTIFRGKLEEFLRYYDK